MLSRLRITNIGRIPQGLGRARPIFIRNYALKFTPVEGPPEVLEKIVDMTRSKFLGYDPENSATGVDALCTKYGWYYVPKTYVGPPDVLRQIEKELDEAGASPDTPKEEIQQFILEWCKYNVVVGHVKGLYELRTTQQLLDGFSKKQEKKRVVKEKARQRDERKQEQAREREEKRREEEREKKEKAREMKEKQKKAKEEEKKKAREERLAMKKLPHGLKFRYNEETGKWDVLLIIGKNQLKRYFFVKKLEELEKQGVLPEDAMTMTEEAWKNLTEEELNKICDEFHDLLTRGWDVSQGKIVPLESKLREEVYELGIRVRKST
ncbi:hypothetical protein Cantr_00826 [Candida viswanathii]|uniref:Uncharacterized protein n=1 Tax=Candida viswanathii TaxID=5486 RepID=A0A367YG72_9ASCO|nr:hypothetical protein Cantr_00826 [Candida viswanathii]